jgi:hypothetical protein
MMEEVEHLSERQIEQYRARTLAPGEFIRIARHLAACDDCQQELLTLAPWPVQLDPLTLDIDAAAADVSAPSFHLNYDEHLAPYVDGGSDEIDREIVESHVALCADCATQLHELFAVQAEIAHPAGPTPPTSRPPPAPPYGMFSARERGTGARRMAPALIACVTALMLISVAVMLWRARPEPTPRVGDQADRDAADSTARSAPVSPTPTAQSASAPKTGGNLPANDNERLTDTRQPAQATKPTQTAPPSPRAEANRLLVSLNDGVRTLTLDRQCRLGGWPELPTQYQRLVTDALLARHIETAPEIALLTDRAGRLRGSADSTDKFALLSPAGTLTRTGQPTLRWQTLVGATGYTVKIYDAALNLVAVSPSLMQTTWRPATPLETGATYSWQVTAEKDGVPVLAPQAQESRALFRVLSPAQQAELVRDELVAGDSHLLRGLVYARFGLLDEAEGEWQTLRAANPGAKVPRELLRQLKARRGARP